MSKSNWLFYFVVGVMVIVYFAGEVSGYLFFAFLIIVPLSAWLLNKLTSNE